jgi:hypothetical protein
LLLSHPFSSIYLDRLYTVRPFLCHFAACTIVFLIFFIGVVYDRNIYIVDDSNPEVFNPSTSDWLTWPAPPNKSGNGPCLLAWKDSILLLGGELNRRGVQQFNLSTKTWKILDSSNLSMAIYFSGCVVLPTEDILIVGSEIDPYRSSAALYNVSSNTWTQLDETNHPRDGTSLVTLGSRVFVVDGWSSYTVEEFDFVDNTW